MSNVSIQFPQQSLSPESWAIRQLELDALMYLIGFSESDGAVLVRLHFVLLIFA